MRFRTKATLAKLGKEIIQVAVDMAWLGWGITKVLIVLAVTALVFRLVYEALKFGWGILYA